MTVATYLCIIAGAFIISIGLHRVANAIDGLNITIKEL